MVAITCPVETLPPPAIVARAPRATPNPNVPRRPVLQLARKPAARKVPPAVVKTLCELPAAPGGPSRPIAALQLPVADALPMLAGLPAVPAAPTEPLAFEAPGAGQPITWRLAPDQLPPVLYAAPYTFFTAPLPVVPEPPTLLLVGAGLVAVLPWRRR